MRQVTSQEIAAGLRALGVSAGDALLFHSSLSSFGRVVGGADAVIDALLAAVAPGGTILCPTYTPLNIETLIFHPDKDEANTGRIPDTLWRRPDAVRSSHPCYSWASIGPRAAELMADHDRWMFPYGARQPMYLMTRAAKIALLGVDQNTNSAIHLGEELADPPYLDAKKRADVVSVKGYYGLSPAERRRLLDLHCTAPRRSFTRFKEVFAREGVMSEGRIGEATVRLLDAEAMIQCIVRHLRRDPQFMVVDSA